MLVQNVLVVGKKLLLIPQILNGSELKYLAVMFDSVPCASRSVLINGYHGWNSRRAHNATGASNGDLAKVSRSCPINLAFACNSLDSAGLKEKRDFDCDSYVLGQLRKLASECILLLSNAASADPYQNTSFDTALFCAAEDRRIK
jgi:hypothetical protein